MVVWFHADGPLSSYIDVFLMPLFFFLSGMLFIVSTKIEVYVKKKVKSLLIPFWLWNFLLLIPFWGMYYWKDWDIAILGGYVLRIGLTVDKVPMLGATWFLPALFWTSIAYAAIYYYLAKLGKGRDVVLLIIAIGFCVLGMWITFPYRISRTLICSMFYIFGYLYNKYIKGKINNFILVNILALFCLAAYIWITSFNKINLAENEFRYKILFVIGVCFAIYTVLILAKDISLYTKENVCIKHIIYLGRNTMPIVIWQFVFFRIAIIVQMLVGVTSMESIFSFPVFDSSGAWWLLYLFSGIYGSLGWQIILNDLKVNFVYKESKY